eukprot:Gb_35301 [translate_table: standard]
MGLLVSCARSAPHEYIMHAIRVVHLNGFVDEFLPPVKVKEVLLPHPRHFIRNSRDLQGLNARPLQPEEELQVGELYFLLPLAVLQGGISATHLKSLEASKFSANNNGGSTTDSAAMAPLLKTKKVDGSVHVTNSNEYFQRLLAKARLPELDNCVEFQKKMGICDSSELQKASSHHMISKSRPWRPRLGTIQENCFAY